ncbi:putative acyltransferase 3 domain-containing protein [Septoria linicola]|nr:putative acyltransferase 3 domain-containing protein [Septoria linicola]
MTAESPPSPVASTQPPGLLSDAVQSWSCAGVARLPRRVGYALTPTPVRAYFFNEHIPPRKLHSTSWMDGLRGLCAIIVFNSHFLFAFSRIVPLGYRTPQMFNESNHIAALPPFCFLWSGLGAVDVFFAIAGYVCSLRALQLMHLGSSAYDSVLIALSSSVFRRAFRLYLPVIVITLLTAFFTYAGGFGLTSYMCVKPARAKYLPGDISEVNPLQFETLPAQLHYWFNEMSILMNVWAVGPVYTSLDPHLWTIAYEFRASLHLYIVLLGLSRCRPIIRYWGLCGFALLYASWYRWEGPLFFLGAAAAQWDVISAKQEDEKTPRLPTSHSGPATSERSSAAEDNVSLKAFTRNPRSWLASHHRNVLWLIAIYFSGYPVKGYVNPAPGYTWINAFIPAWYRKREFRFARSIGTLTLLYLLRSSNSSGVGHQTRAHALLTSRVAQYLGQIMFALYLVHGTVLHALGYAITWWTWGWIGGNQGTLQWLIGILVGWSISLSVTIWIADVFNREVESRCVSLTKWIEGKCMNS